MARLWSRTSLRIVFIYLRLVSSTLGFVRRCVITWRITLILIIYELAELSRRSDYFPLSRYITCYRQYPLYLEYDIIALRYAM